RVGLTRQSVSKIASELAEFGLVRLVDAGRFRRASSTDLPSRRRAASRGRTHAFEQAVLRSLPEEGLAPELLRRPETTLRVRCVTSGDLETLFGLLSDGPGQDASGELFLCPECGSFVGTAAKSCPFCGVEFDVSADSGLSEQIEDFVVEEDAPARICLTCGA